MILVKNKKLKWDFFFIKAINSIFGIGIFLSREFLKRMGVSAYQSLKVQNLSKFQSNLLLFWVSFLLLERRLLRSLYNSISLLKENKTYRGTRHSGGLPVRGGRARTNARTVKHISFSLFTKFKRIL